MWLGNIASHVTVEGLFEVFNKYGELTDGAVFPARIGPLGYAFLNFRYVEDAVRAYEALNNHCVPALSASKLLKLRFKPAQVHLALAALPLNVNSSVDPVCCLQMIALQLLLGDCVLWLFCTEHA